MDAADYSQLRVNVCLPILFGIFNSGLLDDAPDAQENFPDGIIIEEPAVIREVGKPVFYYIRAQGNAVFPAASGRAISKYVVVDTDNSGHAIVDYRRLTGWQRGLGTIPSDTLGRIRSLMAGRLG
ncbi:hypothetical protein BDW62DRAFT_193224 [Aspergillus aurantiobrunneus]